MNAITMSLLWVGNSTFSLSPEFPEYHLYLKLEKWEFHHDIIHFLWLSSTNMASELTRGRYRQLRIGHHPHHQRTTTLLGVCKLLQEVHQQDLLTSILLVETWGQVPVLELRSNQCLQPAQESLQYRFYPSASQSRTALHRQGWCVHHRGRSRLFGRYKKSRDTCSHIVMITKTAGAITFHGESTELPAWSHHRINIIPLHTVLITAPVSLVRWAFWHSSCPPLDIDWPIYWPSTSFLSRVWCWRRTSSTFWTPNNGEVA